MLKVKHEGNLDADNRFVIKSSDDRVSYTIDLSSVMKQNEINDSDKKKSKNTEDKNNK